MAPDDARDGIVAPAGLRLAATSALAIALSVVAVLAIALVAGVDAVIRVFGDLKPVWIGLCAGASVVVYPAYTVSYLALVSVTAPRQARVGEAWRTVIAGFGPFSVAGGFRVDLQALRALDRSERIASAQVLAMGALEWAVLAPLAWVASIVLLAQGAAGMSQLLWPWATAVPVGFAIALWVTAPERAARLSRADRPGRHWLLRVSAGFALLRTLARRPRKYARAWLGIAVYWAADIAVLYGALRACGIELGISRLIIAYATGYVATRRSLPLGGAGITEALMTYALYWVHVPLAPALAAVVIYRGFNFLIVAAPGVFSYRWLLKLIRDGRSRTVPGESPASGD